MAEGNAATVLALTLPLLISQVSQINDSHELRCL